jgi:hypothetical protein
VVEDLTEPPIVHFVGSIPLPDAETVFRRLAQTTVTTAILSARYINPKNIDVLENALRRAGLPER